MSEKKSATAVLLLLIVACLIGPAGQAQTAQRQTDNILSSAAFTPSQTAMNEWRSKLKKEYERSIAALPASVKTMLLTKGDEALTFDWPALPATSFLEFKQNGTRVNYERKQSKRRDYLNRLAIAELVSGDGKYLPRLIDGLWATLEESSWEIPAIVAIQKKGKDLPDPAEHVVGLVSAETAAVIASIQFMLGSRFDQVSSMINRRITAELNRRIMEPYLSRNDFWWMGFTGRPVNNWNAWINTNVLYVGLLGENNMPVLDSIIKKTTRSTDHFTNAYHPDGGCDEGAVYWSLAGGKLIRMLSLLNELNPSASFKDQSMLHNMGTYIYKVQVSGNWFVNFADAAARTIPNPVSVYKFGELFQDRSLKEFSSYLFGWNNRHVPDSNIVEFLETAVVYDSLTQIPARAIKPSFAVLPDLQVVTARSNSAGGREGLFLAVQGGHNGESHNHNDVGNFVIYADGRPVIIDAGVGTYTAQTFSEDRYKIWTMQSQWHNCPDINGVQQKDGALYAARNFKYSDSHAAATVSMDIAGAYPAEAKVKRWQRQLILNRSKQTVSLVDNYELDEWLTASEQHFLSSCSIRVVKDQLIEFYDARGSVVLRLSYDASVSKPTIDEKIMDDPKLKDIWGQKLYRLSFKYVGKSLKGEKRFLFTLPPSNDKN